MTDRQNDTKSMALFCDFENVALGVREAKYQDFDINKVLERLLLKGSIVVKKAYCDWGRYREFKATMHQASFELIEIPHVRMSGKNSADIRMVVDALDLCYTKSHVDTFVIISGDSDFSPLVSKLRENAKTVIGVGVKNSTSELLINNCDEFIYYDDLVRAAAPRPSRRRTGERTGERSAERTGDRTGERSAERTAERSSDRAERTGERSDRTGERGGERHPDRHADRGAERGADRHADRGTERAGDRGPDRTRRPASRRGEGLEHAMPASMSAPQAADDAQVMDADALATLPSVSPEVLAGFNSGAGAQTAADAPAGGADSEGAFSDGADSDGASNDAAVHAAVDPQAAVEPAPRPAARRPRRKAGAVAAESVMSAASAVAVPVDPASLPASAESSGVAADEPLAPAAPARRRRSRKAVEAEAQSAASAGLADPAGSADAVSDPNAAAEDAAVAAGHSRITDQDAGDDAAGDSMAAADRLGSGAGNEELMQASAGESRPSRSRPARGRQRGRGSEPAAAMAPDAPWTPNSEAARDEDRDEHFDRTDDASHDGLRDDGNELREEARDDPRDQRSDDKRLEALELVVGMIEALAAERGDGEKIWGSMVKQTLKRRKPGFNETYYGFRSFNRLLEEARDRGLIELDLDDKSGGYTVRSLV